MKKKGKHSGGRRRPAKSKKKMMQRAAVAAAGLAAGLSLAAGLGHVDRVIRATMLPGSPPILQGGEDAPLRYRLGILGREVVLDLTGAARVLEEARALAATPPAPVRAGLWLWLRLRQ